MKTASKKKQYASRNTGMFFALVSQLPGYESRYRDLIKEGVINDFLTGACGENHGRELRLSCLTDMEYRELIFGLQQQVNRAKDVPGLQAEAVRKRLIHQILTALSRIGVTVVNGDYSEVNYHIAHLPISKGRLIYRFPTDELPTLLGAVRAYCDNIRKSQTKEKALAERN